MRKVIIIFVVMIGFCYGLFGQPKPFDPKYYRDSLKVQKSDEFKKLENYRDKFKKLGLDKVQKSPEEYPNYKADELYHFGINLDETEQYSKLGLDIDSYNNMDNIPGNPVPTDLVAIGKVINFGDNPIPGGYKGYVDLEIEEIYKGASNFPIPPRTVRVYISEKPITYKTVEKTGEKFRYRSFFGNLVELDQRYILYLRKFLKDDTFNIPDYDKANVFVGGDASLISADTYLTSEILEVIKKICKILDELDFRRIKK